MANTLPVRTPGSGRVWGRVPCRSIWPDRVATNRAAAGLGAGDAIVVSADAIIVSCNAIIASADAIVVSADKIVASGDKVVASADTVVASGDKIVASADTTIAAGIIGTPFHARDQRAVDISRASLPL